MKGSRSLATAVLMIAGSARFVQALPDARDLPVAPLQPVHRFGQTNILVLANARMEVTVFPSAGRFAISRFLDAGPVHRMDTASLSAPAAADAGWKNHGGDWLWPVAQKHWTEFFGADWPPARAIDGEPWEGKAWTTADASSVCALRRTIGPPLNIEITRTLHLDSAAARLTVRQRIESKGPSRIPVTLWCISQMAGVDEVVLPDEGLREPPPFRVLGFAPPPEDLVARCESSRVVRVGAGTEHKFGSASPRIWVGGRNGRTALLLRSARDDAEGRYPDQDCPVEVYANRGLGYAEIEILSPERVLAPGEHIENTVILECLALPGEAVSCRFADATRRFLGEVPAPPPAPAPAAP
jgi:hypothetical protein